MKCRVVSATAEHLVSDKDGVNISILYLQLLLYIMYRLANVASYLKF